jgi:hypothetical protein
LCRDPRDIDLGCVEVQGLKLRCGARRTTTNSVPRASSVMMAKSKEINDVKESRTANE